MFVATVVFGVSATVSGWMMLHRAQARWSGGLLVTAGLLALAGCSALVLDLGAIAPILFTVTGCVALPAALLTYPRASWDDPFSFILVVVVLGAGAVAVVWPAALESMGFVIVLGLLIRAWWSFERADLADRRALSWAIPAWFGAAVLAGFVGFAMESVAGIDDELFGTVAVSLMVIGPPAMVVGVLRPEVVDVRGLVTRVVVAGTVFITYIATTIGLLSLVEALSGELLGPAPTVVLCALLAFGVRPLQVMLRGVIDRLLFGDRPDPLRAATSLADRISDDPTIALDAIREALVLPYASMRVEGQVLATSGSEVTHVRVLPLRLGEDEVVVGLRTGDLRLSSADADVLRIVAPLLSQTLRARAMSRDLQASREAVVTAVEEERRRLRRDLHDGLGPTLTGVAFSADAARNQLASDPGTADDLLVRLRSDTADAITEVRRLVEGLRPPALDELGLVAAVRQHAASLHASGGRPLSVDVVVSNAMPDLSAAVEVATYRIVVEALTNVVRHSGASAATVDLVVADRHLCLSVTDSGRSAAPWTPGVGIASMRERCQLVGGTLTLTHDDSGGVVHASIPLSAGLGPTTLARRWTEGYTSLRPLRRWPRPMPRRRAPPGHRPVVRP